MPQHKATREHCEPAVVTTNTSMTIVQLAGLKWTWNDKTKRQRCVWVA